MLPLFAQDSHGTLQCSNSCWALDMTECKLNKRRRCHQGWQLANQQQSATLPFTRRFKSLFSQRSITRSTAMRPWFHASGTGPTALESCAGSGEDGRDVHQGQAGKHVFLSTGATLGAPDSAPGGRANEVPPLPGY